MKIRTGNILALPAFKNTKLLAGKKGLNKNVNWFYLAETLPSIFKIHEWMCDNDILILIGHGIKSGLYTFKDVINQAISRNLSGIVVFIGEYIQEIPQDIIDLCDEVDLPLIAMDWEIPYSTLTREISQCITEANILEKNVFDLVDSILFIESVPRENILRHAKSLNLDMDQNYHVVIFRIQNMEKHIARAESIDAFSVQTINNRFMDVVMSAYRFKEIKPLTTLKNSSVISLVTDEEIQVITHIKFIRMVEKNLQSIYPELVVSVGVGTKYADFTQLKQSYKEAVNVIKLRTSKLIPEDVLVYDQTGIYKLLCEMDHPSMLRRFYPDILLPIIRYDKAKQSDLLDTLEKYLATGKSLQLAAEDMYVHRNTVKYRIDKVRELTELDFNDMEVCFNVLFEIKVYRFLSRLHPEHAR